MKIFENSSSTYLHLCRPYNTVIKALAFVRFLTPSTKIGIRYTKVLVMYHHTTSGNEYLFISDLGILNSVAPIPLKEQFLKLLESKVDALEEMSNILKMEDTATKYATVCELVGSYEERSGQLSLDEWKNILYCLGFGKDFHLCLTAHQRGLMVVGGK